MRSLLDFMQPSVKFQPYPFSDLGLGSEGDWLWKVRYAKGGVLYGMVAWVSEENTAVMLDMVDVLRLVVCRPVQYASIRPPDPEAPDDEFQTTVSKRMIAPDGTEVDVPLTFKRVMYFELD